MSSSTDSPMGFSDDITLVALIVSLVALFVALLQFFQSTFTTAEGGRRCKRTVMGEWSTLTKWTWNWSEFRFEVKYITPEIRILTHNSSQINDKRIPPHTNQSIKSLSLRYPYLLDYARLPGKLESVFFTLRRSDANPRPLLSDLEKVAAERKPTRMSSLMESTKLLLHDRQQEEEAASGVTFVSWYALLYRLHQLEYLTHHIEMTSRDQVEIDEPIAMHPVVPYKPTDANRTATAVYMRRYSWDLMPPDVVRPLALTRLGDLLVLAQRLAMRWRSIDLKSGLLHAEGDGCTMSATTIRGLGLVMTFQRTGQDTGHWARPFIPCKEVDMMLCGVLPLCEKTLPEHFALGRCEVIDENRELSAMGKLFDRLKCRPSADLIWQEPCLSTAPLLNDLIAMVAPFMPLDNSPLKDIPPLFTFPGAEASVIGTWLGRETLRKRLQHRCQEVPKLAHVFKRLDKLCNMFPSDFYCFYDSRECRISRKVESVTVPRELAEMTDYLQTLRTGFNSIIEWFREAGPPELLNALISTHLDQMLLHVVCADHDLSGRDLASLRRTIRAGDLHSGITPRVSWVTEALRGQESEPNRSESSTVWAHLTNESIARGSKDSGINGMIWANLYADTVEEHSSETGPSGVGLYNGVSHEEAWWMLIVRAIYWKMSHWTRPHPIDKSTLVPGMYYESQMPVWIS